MECDNCGGEGMEECPEMCGGDRDCEICGGFGEVECNECDGTGRVDE